MKVPRLVVIAGPNGSGKTTLTSYLRKVGVDFGEYINPDDIAASLEGDYDDRVRHAQVIADERRKRALLEERDFSFESVFSHPSKLDVMREARDRGFNVTLFFVATDDPRINVERVLSRVAMGGHDVPIDKIVARYRRSLDLLPAAIKLSDRVVLFDNSTVSRTSRAIAPVAELNWIVEEKRHHYVVLRDPLPHWVPSLLAFRRPRG